MESILSYQSEEIGELAAALAAAQARFTFAVKDSTAVMGTAGKRKYADLQSVLEAIRDGLTANGLAVIQAPMPADNGIKLRTTLAHKSGQWMASELCLPQDRMGGVQGMGSALTYARRYALAAMVGIAQDDDDGETAMAESKKAAKAQHAAESLAARKTNPSPASKELLAAFWTTMKKRHPGVITREEFGAEVYKDIGSFLGRTVTTLNAVTENEIKAFLAACNVGEPVNSRGEYAQ